MRSYVTVARSTSDGGQRDTALRERVEKVESKLDKVMELLEKLLLLQTQALTGQLPKPGSSTASLECSLTSQTRVSPGLNDTEAAVLLSSPQEQVLADTDSDPEQDMGDVEVSEVDDTTPAHQATQEMDMTPAGSVPAQLKGKVTELTKEQGQPCNNSPMESDITPSPLIRRKQQRRSGPIGKPSSNLTKLAFIPDPGDE